MDLVEVIMAEDGLAQRRMMFQRCIEDRDVELAGQVLAEGYALELVHPERAVVRRDEWLVILESYVLHDYAIEEEIVDELADDLSVVLSRVRMSATVAGNDRSGTFVLSDVWRRGNDGWQVCRRHSTPLQAGGIPRQEV